jgi:methylmalonyl-CoA/ethylmalonyl-CoA epimerase
MDMTGFGLNRIGQISIGVRDLARAVGFYRDVLKMKFLFEFPGMAFFDCGGVRLYLSASSSAEGIGTSLIYYRVPSIRDAVRALEERGVSFVQGPTLVHQDDRHELWLADFKDPEGNNVALMSEVAKPV